MVSKVSFYTLLLAFFLMLTGFLFQLNEMKKKEAHWEATKNELLQVSKELIDQKKKQEIEFRKNLDQTIDSLSKEIKLRNNRILKIYKDKDEKNHFIDKSSNHVLDSLLRTEGL